MTPKACTYKWCSSQVQQHFERITVGSHMVQAAFKPSANGEIPIATAEARVCFGTDGRELRRAVKSLDAGLEHGGPACETLRISRSRNCAGG